APERPALHHSSSARFRDRRSPGPPWDLHHMTQRHRWGARALATTLLAFALATTASHHAGAASSLSGYTYIDRNNDGQLAFADSVQPEWVLSGVEVKLYSVSGSTETLLSTTTTSSIGVYSFTGLAAGTYTIRQ